jgi:hypothetical protein
MSARDLIHRKVKTALIKDGWTITDDPFTIQYEDAILFADLAAERTLAAEKAGRKILVEIKSFVGPSPIHDLKIALGQYQLYLPLLQTLELDYKLYLAISDEVYANTFQRQSFQLIVGWYDLPIIVVNLELEEIEQWIN